MVTYANPRWTIESADAKISRSKGERSQKMSYMSKTRAINVKDKSVSVGVELNGNLNILRSGEEPIDTGCTVHQVLALGYGGRITTETCDIMRESFPGRKGAPDVSLFYARIPGELMLQECRVPRHALRKAGQRAEIAANRKNLNRE